MKKILGILLLIFVVVFIVFSTILVTYRQVQYNLLAPELVTYHISGYDDVGILIKKDTLIDMQNAIETEKQEVNKINNDLKQEASSLGLDVTTILNGEDDIYVQNELLQSAIDKENNRLAKEQELARKEAEHQAKLENEKLVKEASELKLDIKAIIGDEKDIKKQNELLKIAIAEEEERLAEAEKKAQEKAAREEKKNEEKTTRDDKDSEAAEESESEDTTDEVIEEETISEDTVACEPYYVDDILIVNKDHCLDESYAPGGLTSETQAAFDAMQSDASSEGYELHILSGYRSYNEQVDTYNYWVSVLGEEGANAVSAKPGYSEHQTGLAIDIGVTGDSSCDLQVCFGSTPEGKWVSENAHKYGFIIRYPSGSEHITGYSYEPWHLRYVGVDVATDIYNQGITLEEYVGIY